MLSTCYLTKSYPHCKIALTMTDTYTPLWKATLAIIQSEVSEGNFFALFKQTALLSIENQTATIAAPSSIVINLLQRHKETIQKALLVQNQQITHIIFVPKTVATNKKEEKPTPLFTQEPAKQFSVGHVPRVRPDYMFTTLAVSQSNQLA